MASLRESFGVTSSHVSDEFSRLSLRRIGDTSIKFTNELLQDLDLDLWFGWRRLALSCFDLSARLKLRTALSQTLRNICRKDFEHGRNSVESSLVFTQKAFTKFQAREQCFFTLYNYVERERIDSLWTRELHF